MAPEQDQQTKEEKVEIAEVSSALKASLDKAFCGAAAEYLKSVIDEYTVGAANKKVDNSTRSRLLVAGANENIMEVFLNCANGDVHLIANMTYGKTRLSRMLMSR